ncbi:methyltransferase [Virgisporangium aliadipatigenens]|uniref:Methyltransferase n=1 Tax=Virgisporangium aliadipatigenens TaxID=741659 RepID=A0A8J4DQH3_9ACTN|nr:class I SAM-dependent methyltransferase [Virgisporangium aliadipatigenens]GIJ46614.1 methyltransferase [Virgisporangium aliadipatigenens]
MGNWYTDFFTELPNAFWRAAVPPEHTTAEVDFLTRFVPAGAHVLDVPCGSGRHTLALAGRGYRVTGLDVSAEAIAHAKRQAPQLDLRVVDMAELPSDLRADAAICMGNSFGYLPHEGTERFLATLAGIAGTLVLDTGFVAESLLHNLQVEEEPMTLGGIEATSVNSYDVADSAWITEFTFRRGDEVHRGTSVQHVYTSAEIARLVRRAGYADVRMFGDVDGGPYRLGSPRLLLVARQR